jgi:Domain of unknown function (DUF2828)
MNLSSSDYRKMLVSLSKTVEQKIAAGDRKNIDYAHVPSIASARYQKLFMKHDAEKYLQFIQDVIQGKTQIKAAAIYPYDIIKSLDNGIPEVAMAQWKALPNYLTASDRRILPMCDVS